MKGYFLFFACLLASFLNAQITQPYALWEDSTQTYNLVRVDPATGNQNVVNSLVGITGLVVPNTTVYKPTTDEYLCTALYTTTTLYTRLNASNGNPLGTVVTTDNVVGLRYNCGNDTIYGLYEQNNNYSFIWMDHVAGMHHVIAALPGVSAHAGSSFTMNTDSGYYSFVGLLGASLTFFRIDIQTGAIINQSPFNQNVVGQFYNPNDGKYYGLWEDTSFQYWLVEIDPTTGVVTPAHLLSGITPGFISESATYNPMNNQVTYRGFAGPTATVFAIDAASGTITASAPLGGNAAGFEDFPCLSCPLPVASFSDSTDQLLVMFTDMSGFSPNSWFWDFGDGNTSTMQHPVHSYAENGTYEVCLIVTNACGSDTICDSLMIVQVDKENMEEMQVEVYPVPANEQLMVRAHATGAAVCRLYSRDGKMIRRKGMEKGQTVLDTQDLPAGLYFLEIEGEGLLTRKKVSILH